MSGSTLGSIARIGITVAASYYGGPVGGALGSIAANALFPPKLPGVVEPIAPDQPFTNSAEGLPLPEFFGSCVTGGNVIWDGGRRVITNKKKVGGKGGPSQSQTTRTYLRSYAIGLGKEIGGVRRLWRNGSIVYDRRPQQDGETDAAYTKRLAASDELDEQMTIYLGTDDQLPDPTIEAALGVGNAPAYRRRSYIVLRDMDETPRAGAISTWKIEVTRSEVIYTLTTKFETDYLAPWIDADDPRNPSFPDSYTYSSGTLIDDTLPAAQTQWLSDNNGGAPIYTSANFTYLHGHSVTVPRMSRVYADDNTDKLFLSLHYNRLLPDHDPVLSDDNFVGNVFYDDLSGIGCYQFAVAGVEISGGRFWWSGLDENGSGVGSGSRFGIFRLEPYAVALDSDEDGVNNCTNYPPSGGFFPTARYIRDAVIRVRRVPVQPPVPGSEFPDWPVDPDNYTWDESTNTVYPKIEWTLYGGDFHSLGIYEPDVPTNTVIQDPLGPIVMVGGAGDDEVTWTAAYNAAVSLGTIDAGKTYDASGMGGVNTYPRYIDHAWTRTYLAVTYSDDLGVSLGSIVRRCSELADLAEEQIDVADLTEIVRGFQLDSFINARSAIDALRRYGFFDVVASGNQIKFPRRGKASVAQLELTDMGAHLVGEAEPERVRPEYLNDQELPRVVRVSYINQDGEYQRGQQLRGRTVTNSQDTLDVQVPVVMGADKAAQIRDVALAEKWIGREEYTIPGRPIWLVLEAADPIVFPLRGELQRAIITKNTGRPGGVQTFELRRDDASIYYPTATGVPSGVGEQVLDELGDTTLIIIDGPALLEAHDDAGVYLAARGEGERWRGYGLFQSLDGGSNYDRIFDAEDASTMGTITAALPVGPHHLWDRANSLEVTLDFGTLESRDEAAVAGGANPAWIGHPSRGWELVLFADAVLTGTDSEGRPIYTVSTFLRGRQGTEWAIGNSEAGDYFILADTCDRLPLESSQISVSRIFKAVTFGKLVEAGPTQTFTPAGVALECYAPVLISGSRDGSGNLQILGSRRARISGEWNDSDFVPLNEETEAYEVDVLDGVTVVRTISASSFPIAYSAANQVTDFGSAQGAIDIVVYQLSATVGRGYPTEATV